MLPVYRCKGTLLPLLKGSLLNLISTSKGLLFRQGKKAGTKTNKHDTVAGGSMHTNTFDFSFFLFQFSFFGFDIQFLFLRFAFLFFIFLIVEQLSQTQNTQLDNLGTRTTDRSEQINLSEPLEKLADHPHTHKHTHKVTYGGRPAA